MSFMGSLGNFLGSAGRAAGNALQLPFDVIGAYSAAYKNLPAELAMQRQAGMNALQGQRDMMGWLKGLGQQPQQPQQPGGQGPFDGGYSQDQVDDAFIQADQGDPRALQAMGGAPGTPPPQSPDLSSAPRLPSFDEAAPYLAAAVAAGVPGVDRLATIIKDAQPNVQFINGVGVDPRDRGNIGKRVGVDLKDINGTLIDLQNPTNADRYVPEAPAKGMEPLYDRSGNVTAWRNMDGSIQGMREQAMAAAGAAGGPAPLPMANGQSRRMSNRPGDSGRTASDDDVGASQSTADQEYAKARAKAAAERYANIQSAGQQAAGKIETLTRIDQLLAGYEGGKLAPAGLEIASAANSLGLPMDEKMSNAQAADALLKTLAQSDPAVPGLQNSQSSRQQLIQMGIAKAQREQQVAAMARQWQQRFGRIDTPDGTGKSFEDYLQAWSNARPLYGKNQ